MCDEDVQKVLIEYIIRIFVEYKKIISTRDLLNFIYELIVPPELIKYAQNDNVSDFVDYLLPNMLFNNPILLFLGGWLIAFALGSTIVGSVVNGLYNGIEQGLEYATNKGTYTSHYEDNYRMFNEVLIGKNYNNLEKRKSIEKIYSISKKVLLVRLLISIIILVILSFM